MSDENNEIDTADDGSATTPAAPSIFDLFEPPPEIDANRFGPIPVVSDRSADPIIVQAGEDTAEAAEVVDDFEDGFADGDVDHDGVGELADPPSVDDLLGPLETDDVQRSAADLALTSESKGLQDWTAPATGQVPAVLESARQDSGWSDLDGPRWHGEDPEWGSEDFREVFSGVEGVSHVGVDAEPTNLTFDDTVDDAPHIPTAAGAPQRADRQPARQPRARQRPSEAAAAAAASSSGDRDVTMAIGAGIVMVALALIAIRVESHIPLLAIVTIAAAVGASEFYLQLRKNGLHPATLLGITAAASVPLSVYYRGESAYPMVIALTIIFGAIWYVVGADEHKPALNMSLTLFGVGWIGVLGSFAVLLFNAPNQDGHGLLLGAVVVAVASDTGAFAFGRWLGKTPFHPASKNKTWEGTIGGVVTAVVAGLVLFLLGQTPFQGVWWHAVALGLVGGILGPIGDLTESLIKRDLGVKDMGAIIPGHGGVLDRIDGLLFVIPGVYYLSVMLDLI